MAKSGQRLIVYYDGWCPLCTSLRDRIARLDWLQRISFASIREPGLAAELGFSPEHLAARMHAHDPTSGTVVDGVHAAAAIAGRLPLLWPLWPLLRLSAMVGLGQPLYDLITRQRRIVPVGACDEQGCPLTPHPGSQANSTPVQMR